VRVDQELVIRAVDRVVENRGVQPDLCTGQTAQRAVEDQHVTDLRRHRFVDAFLCAAFGNMRAVRAAEQDPDRHARVGLLGEQAHQPGVVGEEESAVDEDADVALSRAEQVPPDVARDGPAVRVDGDDLILVCRRDLIPR
jgi:hypothetical protein